jgi:hypothetical protein
MVRSSGNSRGLEVALAAGLALAGIALLLLRGSMPLAAARSAADRLAASVAAKDLAAVQSASSPAFYQGLLEKLSSAEFQRARRVYEVVVPQVAYGHWRGHRERAVWLADQQYDRLRMRVEELGRLRFEQLSSDERMRLIDSNGFDGFVTNAGLQALPEIERAAIGDVGAFGTRAGRAAYVEQAGWALLPEADRALLGSADALSEDETAAKLAFFDKVALPLLTEEDRQLASRYPRASVASLGAFARAHGSQVAKDLLAAVTMQPPSRPTCSYPETEAGRILWPTQATCDVAMAINGNSVRFRLDPVKAGNEWRIQSASGELASALAP